MQEEARKQKEEKKAKSWKWPTTPTALISPDVELSASTGQETTHTQTTSSTRAYGDHSPPLTAQSNTTLTRQTSDRLSECAESSNQRERKQWRLFGTGEKYD